MPTDIVAQNSEMQNLYNELARLQSIEQERDLALEAYHQERQRADTLQAELEYSRMQMQRSTVDREELRKLREWKASRLAICAVSHDRLSPYSKLALITSTEQVPYSASLHGGDETVMLTSMKQWNKAIGGDEDNTNCLNRALKPLEESGTVKRTPIDTGDGRSHYTVEVNEQHLQHPRFINPDVVRPHNGGNKRCPQCGNFCKKKLTVTYECASCGIDFDADMKPIEHTTPSTPVTPEPEPVVQEPITQEVPVVKIPRCQHMLCAVGAMRVVLRPWGGFYCNNHNGYVDEEGRPQ